MSLPNSPQLGANADINLLQIRFAISAAELSSFGAAARLLKVKQSTLSRSVADLEEAVGLKLFERSTRGAIPTVAGTAFLRDLSRIIADLDQVVASAERHARGEAGRLSVGFCVSLSAGNLRWSITQFCKAFPGVVLDGIEDDKLRLLRRLLAGEIDVVIIVDELAHPELQKRILWAERVVVALPPDHHLASVEEIYWTDLRDLPFVFQLTCPGPEIAAYLRACLGGPGFEPDIIHQEMSRENVLNLVAIGDRITIIDEAAVSASHPSLVFRDIRETNGHARVEFAAYSRKQNANPALQNFLDLIANRHSATDGI